MKRPDLAMIKATLNIPRVRKMGMVSLGVFIVCAMTLFFAGPPLLKSYLTDSLSKQLGRKVSVGAVHVNPFMLSVAIDDFALAERDGKTPFVAFKQAYVNAQLASIVMGGPILSEIRLTEPRVRLVRSKDEQYNFQDIVDRMAKPEKEKSKEPGSPLRFSLNNIRIIDGQVDFEDQPKGGQHEIRKLNVAIPFLSNLFYRVDDYVQPEFSALINGAELKLTGRSKPFETGRESLLELKLDNVALAEYLPYVPKKLHFSLPSGTLDADLKISFILPQGKAPSLTLSGSAALDDLALNEKKDTPTLRLKHLDVALGSIEPLAKRFIVERIAANDLELFVRRDRQGRINLANLVEPDPNKEPLPYFLVREAVLSKSIVHVRDDYRARPFETTLSDVRLALHNITSEKSKAGQVELSAAGPEGAAFKAGTELVIEPLALSRLGLEINDLRLHEPGGKTDIARIGQFAIAGGALDIERRSMSVDEVSLSKSQLNVQRNKQGVLNVAELANGGAGEAAPSSSSGPTWQYAVKKVALNDVGVRWRDEVPAAGPAEIGVDKIQAVVEGISSAPNSAAKLALNATVGRSGTVGVDGSVALAPLSAKLQLNTRGVPILPAQPYFADKVHISVTSGSLSARGKLDVQEGGKIRYAGEAQVNKFASIDHVNRNDFLKWETLHFGGVNVATEPLNVAINDISLSNFYSRLVINPDGSLNVQHVMGKEAGSSQAVAGETPSVSKAAEEAPPVPAPAKPAEAPKAPPVPVKIGRLTLQGGQVNFSDNFIKPNYSANLTQIGGSVAGLSSDLATTADVEIRGKVDDAAPVEIVGKLNPLSGNLFLDIAASAKGVDLPAATPYSARYAGYPILKGKLSMDVKYRIENRQLTAQNRVVLDQLTFGDKVDSPSATKLPVLLAVALLKDRNGVIDINLPISGSLDDPQFSMGGIIVKVFVNLLVKAVTSPFVLLGSLFGGGEELSYIEFEPGRVALDKVSQDKVQTLTKALEDRPALKLDIVGRVDTEADKEGLRRVAVEHKVKAVKFESLGKQGEGLASLDEVKIDPAEYPALLKQAYGREKFPKPRNIVGLAKDLPVPEMEKLMLTNATVTDDDLRQLAIRRARIVAEAIAKTGKVGAERVFVLEPKLKVEAGEKAPTEKAKASRVDFSLK